jgi:hypothetical protein
LAETNRELTDLRDALGEKRPILLSDHLGVGFEEEF